MDKASRLQRLPTPLRLPAIAYVAAAAVVALAYSPINIAYALSVSSMGAGTRIIPDSSFLAFFAEHVPSIRWTIEGLSGQVEPERLALVVRLYAFAWASGVVDILLQTVLFLWGMLVWGMTVREEDRPAWPEKYERKLSAMHLAILAIACTAMVFALLLDATFLSYGRGNFTGIYGIDTSDIQQMLAWTFATLAYLLAALVTTNLVMLARSKTRNNATVDPCTLRNHFAPCTEGRGVRLLRITGEDPLRPTPRLS